MDLTSTPASNQRFHRLMTSAAVGIVLIIAASAYVYLFYAKPIGSGPAGPRVPRESFASPWTTRSVLLLGIGDSVTAGFGVANAYSYFSRLTENPPDEFKDMRGLCLKNVLPNLQARNIARSGSTSLAHLDTIREQLEQQTPETFGLVVMTTGGNDLIHDYGRSAPREGAMYGASLQQAQPWIENFENRLNETLELIQSRFPGGCIIFMADIYDPTDGLGDAATAGLPSWPDGVAIHQAYNIVVHRCADKHQGVYIVPMYEAFLGHGIHCTQFWRSHYRAADPHYWYAWNLEDPNIRGYDAIRRLFLIEIAKHAQEIAQPKDK